MDNLYYLNKGGYHISLETYYEMSILHIEQALNNVAEYIEKEKRHLKEQQNAIQSGRFKK